MKKLFLLSFIICCISTNLQAQKLKKPRSTESKSIVQNMFASTDYKQLQKLLAINDKVAALELTKKLSRDYRKDNTYVSTLNIITANIHYASKDYATAYTHYNLALPPVTGTELKYILQQASDRCLYHIERIEKEKKEKEKLEKEKKEKEANNKNDVTTRTESEKEETAAFAVIETVPVYPGCESVNNNNERKSCMAKSISQHVGSNFNTGLTNDLHLIGEQKIQVQFKIDRQGNVIGVTAYGNQPNLELEAIRVVNLLPVMQPGTQRGKPVGVIYGLPIIFKVQ